MIKTEPTSLKGTNGTKFDFNLKAEDQTAYTTVSISMVVTKPLNDSSHFATLVTKKYELTFCKKNIAVWVEEDDYGKVQTDTFPMAYVMENYSFAEKDTNKFVAIILNELAFFKPKEVSANEDHDGCKTNCTLF